MMQEQMWELRQHPVLGMLKQAPQPRWVSQARHQEAMILQEMRQPLLGTMRAHTETTCARHMPHTSLPSLLDHWSRLQCLSSGHPQRALVLIQMRHQHE